jgi:hypothetical protein
MGEEMPGVGRKGASSPCSVYSAPAEWSPDAGPPLLTGTGEYIRAPDIRSMGEDWLRRVHAAAVSDVGSAGL